MKSRRTSQFRQMFAELPEPIQSETREAYRQSIMPLVNLRDRGNNLQDSELYFNLNYQP